MRRAHRLAGRGAAIDDLRAQRRVEGLIIGGVELDLIHVHPDQRAFLVRGRPDPAILGKRG